MTSEVEIQEVAVQGHMKRPSDRNIPRIIKWKGVAMIRSQSFMATVQEIIDFSSEIDVTKVGIIGDPHSGKTTLSEAIAHSIHMHAKVPYAIRKFEREHLLNFKETLKTLRPVNHILLFGDLSFMGADATKKQIELVKQASTQIRHLEGGKDVKIISIYDYHYLLGLDKYLRQADFKYITTVGSSDLTNLENMVGSKYVSLIKDFQKYRLKAVTKKVWKIRMSKHEIFAYKYRNPFIPVLFYNNDTLRLIATPKREWIDPQCSKCDEAAGQIGESEVNIEKFCTEGERICGKGAFLSAIKLLMYINGWTVYGKEVVHSLKWIQREGTIKKISIQQVALHYGLKPVVARLRKPKFEESKLIPGTLIEAKDEQET